MDSLEAQGGSIAGQTLMDSQNTPDVTIIIVSYNVRDYLRQCLESIKPIKNRHKLQVIVVDNASHDGTVELLMPEFSWVEFIALSENKGFARANNIGIERAQGRYTLILNPDTIVAENTIDEMICYMEEHPEVGICGCKVLNADGSFQEQCRRGFPTPWVAFSKLFGLQALFPRSRLFAQYNQSYRDPDQTYYVDAVIGAFMFCRTDALRSIKGFDPDYFLYGEDLDLCFRMLKAEYRTAYVPTTSIIHFKGESTRRSRINEVRVFYDAMVLFVRKHYSTRRLLLWLLEAGIWMREQLAHLAPYRRGLVLLTADLLLANTMLLFATSVRFGSPFGFPDYAYPTVFIVLSLVIGGCMVAVGEYFEYTYRIRNAVMGYFVAFFVLSSLTYYWKQYAFSRGVVLMTIGLSMIISSVVRLIFRYRDHGLTGRGRRVLLVGATDAARSIIESIVAQAAPLQVVGIATVEPHVKSVFAGHPILGQWGYIERIITEHGISEVIITDQSIPRVQAIATLSNIASHGVRFYFAYSDVELYVQRIASEIGVRRSELPPLLRLRFRLLKRLLDILTATWALTLGWIIVLVLRLSAKKWCCQWWDVVWGRVSLVGIHPEGSSHFVGIRHGLVSLPLLVPESLRTSALIARLNEYYCTEYTPVLDLEIILRYVQQYRRHHELHPRL